MLRIPTTHTVRYFQWNLAVGPQSIRHCWMTSPFLLAKSIEISILVGWLSPKSATTFRCQLSDLWCNNQIRHVIIQAMFFRKSVSTKPPYLSHFGWRIDLSAEDMISSFLRYGGAIYLENKTDRHDDPHGGLSKMGIDGWLVVYKTILYIFIQSYK